MKILNEKKSICTSMKVLYYDGESFYDDIKQKKKDGWIPVRKPGGYANETLELVIKRASNGCVITYIKYEPVI